MISALKKTILLCLVVGACAVLFMAVYLNLRAAKISLPFESRLEASSLEYASHDARYPAVLADYLSFHRQAILNSQQPALASALDQKQLLLKAPFYETAHASCSTGAGGGAQFRPARAVLLIHGLSDSPYFMRAIAEFFTQNCFNALAIVLPGHTTQPGDLQNASYHDWLKAVAYGVEKLQEEGAKEIHVAGFSVGGTLALASPAVMQHAKSLWLYVPALKIQPQALLTLFAPYLTGFNKKSSWHVILPDEDPYKYESFPLYSIAQTALLVRRAKSNLAKYKRRPPLFIAATTTDSTVDAQAVLRLAVEWENEHKHLLLFSHDEQHLADIAFVDISKKALLRQAAKTNIIPAQVLARASQLKSAAALQAQVSTKPILSVAHTALMIKPEDPVYGRNGWYHDCRFYFNKSINDYKRCKQGQADYLAENLPQFLAQGVVERLRYNPFWNLMRADMQVFLESLKRTDSAAY